MCIGKPHTLRGQSIDVGGGDFSPLGVVALDISIPQVISVENDNVGKGWPLDLPRPSWAVRGQHGQECDELGHGIQGSFLYTFEQVKNLPVQ